MITFYFENGCVATLRTSGTEPKIKYYTELACRPGDKYVYPANDLTVVQLWALIIGFAIVCSSITNSSTAFTKRISIIYPLFLCEVFLLVSKLPASSWIASFVNRMQHRFCVKMSFDWTCLVSMPIPLTQFKASSLCMTTKGLGK